MKKIAFLGSMKRLLLLPWFLALLVMPVVYAASVSTGAAPQGDAKKVASQIIKYNFPQCKKVTKAFRLSDGSIRAVCDGIDYLVFTVYDPREGKMHEVAMNCTAAKQFSISCQ